MHAHPTQYILLYRAMLARTTRNQELPETPSDDTNQRFWRVNDCT